MTQYHQYNAPSEGHPHLRDGYDSPVYVLNNVFFVSNLFSIYLCDDWYYGSPNSHGRFLLQYKLNIISYLYRLLSLVFGAS